MLYLVIVAIAVIAMVYVAFKIYERRLRQKTEQQKQAFFAQADKALAGPGPERTQLAEQAQYTAAFERLGFPLIAQDTSARQTLAQIRHLRLLDYNFDRNIDPFRAVLHDWRNAKRGEYKLPLVEAVFKTYGQFDTKNRQRVIEATGFDPAGAEKAMKGYFDRRYAALLESANDSYDAFLALDKLISSHREHDYASHKIHAYYPDNWDYLVAKHIPQPRLYDFTHTWHGQPPRSLVSMAAEALEDKDYTRAKLVLAYCNDHESNRSRVGAVLIADLAKMIARMDRAKRKAEATT